MPLTYFQITNLCNTLWPRPPTVWSWICNLVRVVSGSALQCHLVRFKWGWRICSQESAFTCGQGGAGCFLEAQPGAFRLLHWSPSIELGLPRSTEAGSPERLFPETGNGSRQRVKAYPGRWRSLTSAVSYCQGSPGACSDSQRWAWDPFIGSSVKESVTTSTTLIVSESWQEIPNNTGFTEEAWDWS